MSRNKDIEMIHTITGWSYKECRRRYHENGHDLWKTLPFNAESIEIAMEGLNKALEALPRIMDDALAAMKNFFDNLDMSDFTKRYEEWTKIEKGD